jgi:hypothetical protein
MEPIEPADSLPTARSSAPKSIEAPGVPTTGLGGSTNRLSNELDLLQVAAGQVDHHAFLKTRLPATPFMALNLMPLPAHRDQAFMARELMLNPVGQLTRTRRHDLESFIWVFAWICEGEESEVRWTWNHPSMSVALGQKSTYFTFCLLPKKIPKTIRDTDESLWVPLCMARYHWARVVDEEEFMSVPASHTEFIKILDESYPREPEHKTWNWIGFEVPQPPRT